MKEELKVVLIVAMDVVVVDGVKRWWGYMVVVVMVIIVVEGEVTGMEIDICGGGEGDGEWW